MPNMKQTDLVPCSSCGKGMMHEGIPIFYRIRLETMGVDAAAVQRQHGMELLMGGNAAIANVLGPNEDIAKEIDSKNLTLCHSCMMNCSAGTLIGGD